VLGLDGEGEREIDAVEVEVRRRGGHGDVHGAKRDVRDRHNRQHVLFEREHEASLEAGIVVVRAPRVPHDVHLVEIIVEDRRDRAGADAREHLERFGKHDAQPDARHHVASQELPRRAKRDRGRREGRDAWRREAQRGGHVRGDFDRGAQRDGDGVRRLVREEGRDVSG
jgi:hypothetical protein